jgi:hypothetical protein
MKRIAKLQALTLVGVCLAGPAGAVDTIEALGAERCGGKVKSYAVDFLAPEDAQLEASTKTMSGGADLQRDTTHLSLDGKACTDARCPFRATKGQTYKLKAESDTVNFDNLCIVVARP